MLLHSGVCCLECGAACCAVVSRVFFEDPPPPCSRTHTALRSRCLTTLATAGLQCTTATVASWPPSLGRSACSSTSQSQRRGRPTPRLPSRSRPRFTRAFCKQTQTCERCASRGWGRWEGAGASQLKLKLHRCVCLRSRTPHPTPVSSALGRCQRRGPQWQHCHHMSCDADALFCGQLRGLAGHSCPWRRGCGTERGPQAVQ